jgi:hypothetical protein
MKNPEIIAKEDDWILCTIAGCLGIAMAFVMLPYALAVLMACLAATNLRHANRLLGISTRLITSILICLGVIWTSLLITAELHLANIHLHEGQQNYFLVAGFLALASWQLLRILVTKTKKSNQRMQRSDR